MPTPFVSIAELQVNTPTPDRQSDATVLAMADGRFMVAWSDRSGQTGDIYTRLFNADGTPFGNTQSVKVGDPTGKQVDPSLAQLADGRVVIAWTDEDSLNVEYSTATFDAAGNPTFSAETSIDPANNYAGWLREPTVSAYANGFKITFTDQGSVSGNDVREIDFFPLGGGFTPSVIGRAVSASITQGQFNPSSVQLTDGRVLVVWADQRETLGTTPFAGDTIRGKIYDPAAGSGGELEFVINNFYPPGDVNPSADQPTAAALAGGGYAVFWTLFTPGGDGGDIRGRIYAANGSVTADFSVASPAGLQYRPTACGLDDGTVVVAWVDTTAGASGRYAIKARIFNADGSASSDEFTVTTQATDDTSATLVSVEVVSIEKLLDGRFVITWNDISFTLDDADQSIHAKIFDPRTMRIEWTGTAAGEQFIGTVYDDNLVGGGGSDSIVGEDGNDAIRGDQGNDTIIGGNGIDRISYWASSGVTLTLAEGGSGTFTFTGVNAGLGTDTYAGIEGIDGSEFNPDFLTGNSSNNILYGFGGNDTLIGGAGADSLLGGEGNDWLYFDGVDTVVFGGNGTDIAIRDDGLSAHGFAMAANGIEELRWNLSGDSYVATRDVATGDVRVVTNDGGPENSDWSSFTTDYTSAWITKVQQGAYDTGGLWSINYDFANNQIFTSYTTVYKAGGILWYQSGTYDNSTTWSINWDTENAGNWTQYTTQYDTQGRTTSQAGTYDNGTRWTINWDAANAGNWREYTTIYNAAGAAVSQTGIYDNGQTWTILF